MGAGVLSAGDVERPDGRHLSVGRVRVERERRRRVDAHRGELDVRDGVGGPAQATTSDAAGTCSSYPTQVIYMVVGAVAGGFVGARLAPPAATHLAAARQAQPRGSR